MEFGVVLMAAIFLAALLYFRSAGRKTNLESASERERIRRDDDVDYAREEAIALVKRGAIFEVTTMSDIRGYHAKELGWVRCECRDRSEAERKLKNIAAEKFKTANSLTKLSHSFENETYQAGTGPNGKPYFQNQKVKFWEAMACESIPNRSVDNSPIQWNVRETVVDGSNVCFWGDEGGASLGAVKAITQLLKKEGSKVIVVFDANIGYKVAGEHIAVEQIRKYLGGNVDVEIVQAGTVADRRIIELAERRRAIIVSNDLFRDSVKARAIPKRRGFFLPRYNYAELLAPRA